MEYEWEYLCWERRQLTLRSKYSDTPPGLRPMEAGDEERRQAHLWKEYEERKAWKLTTAVQLREEPFAGRGSELNQIKNHFAGGSRVVFLSGMGGIGKSALARAYGRRYKEEYDEVLLWSDDRGIEKIFSEDGQLEITNLIYTKGTFRSRRQYAQEKYRRLLQIADTRRLLIILDNCNQQEDPWFEALLEIPCHLLVTTRLSADTLAGQGQVLEVGSLTELEDWRAFYRTYVGKEPERPEWEAMMDYRESVLGHTLKMKLALCSPDQRWSGKRLAKSLFATFPLKKTHSQILCELSFITLQGIPEEVYLACSSESRGDLEILKRYSLVQEGRDSRGRIFLSLHPVIAEAVSVTWHPDEVRCFSFLKKFGFYIRHSWNRPREGDLWLMPQVFSLLGRLPEPAAWRFYPYECLATYLMTWEYFSEAEELERSLYDCVKAYYGEVHQYTAQVAMRVAAVIYNEMRFEESRVWYELGYRLYQEAAPVDEAYWADRAEACEKLARVYEYEEDYEKAFFYTQEAIEAAHAFWRTAEREGSKVWMDKRMRIQYVYLRRARLYFRGGDILAAERDLEYARGLFPLNPFQEIEFRALQIRINLQEGNYEQARQDAAWDLEVSIHYQGESFKDSLSCREQLGDVLSMLGRDKEAGQEYIRVLDCLQEKYPHQTEWMERLRQKM